VPAEQQLYMHRQPDDPRLVGQRPDDGVADPPRGVGGEAQAPRGVELLHRADQPEVALLDEVRQRQPPIEVPAGHLDHQAQIGLDEALLGLLVTRLHAPAQGQLLVAREQRNAADLAEVDAQVGAAGLAGLDPRVLVDGVDQDL
jgi:hypothetical protein